MDGSAWHQFAHHYELSRPRRGQDRQSPPKALPTGNPCDWLPLADGGTIRASLVDVSNPGVFVRVADLGIPADEELTPQAVEGNVRLRARLEEIRRAGASAMGLDADVESVPKIVVLFDNPSPGTDIRCLAMSMGQAHKAVPLALALCLDAASQLPETIPWQAMGGQKAVVTVGHPSGKVDIGTTFDGSEIKSADLRRTARVLIKGDVFY
ncbi:methylitaconate delta2-delta3-isomerase [Colletotrichum sojae]|uniref:Methylitaconate delta2-delta3-isomerase n=1 Tax=Colletotrichum sojae TaxID=2175907 RepID=A0A8H6J3V2_9PEZI|nr:methylitaconate delta2-delta3-isomerase [Colletotrichum sojae]